MSDHDSSATDAIADPNATQPKPSSRLRKRQGESTRRLVSRFVGPIGAFHIMTEADVEKANAALEQLIEGDSVEQEILEELLDSQPLAEPHAFKVAHRTFVRALEVYQRNARRPPSGLPFGFLNPLISPLVIVLMIAISNSYQKRVIRDVRRLYVLREANSPIGSHEHRSLVSARRQVDALTQALAGGFVIPVFLLSGAALSAVASLLQKLLHNDIGRIALLVGVLLVTVWVFLCLVTAASVSRRRTHLVLDQPMNLLWKSIGSAGHPPRERSRAFVAVATLLLLIGWILVPLTAAVIYGIS